MSERENKQELRGKLIHAGSMEEVRAILGPETAEEEINQTWREIETHRPEEGLAAVDDDELEAVSGGADRDWEEVGCSASVEVRSWCRSDDACFWFDVTYSNFYPCSKGGKHDWRRCLTSYIRHDDGSKERYHIYECRKCGDRKTEYDE